MRGRGCRKGQRDFTDAKEAILHSLTSFRIYNTILSQASRAGMFVPTIGLILIAIEQSNNHSNKERYSKFIYFLFNYGIIYFYILQNS